MASKRRGGVLSAARLSSAIDAVTDAVITLLFTIISNGGMIALLAADTIIGGIVLSASWSDTATRTTEVVSWCASFGTSALLLGMWRMVWSFKSWKALMPMFFALALTLVDVLFDVRIVTLWQYGAHVMATTGLIPPHPTFMWKLKTALVGLLALGGPPTVVLIRMTRTHEIRIGGPARKVVPGLDDALDSYDPDLVSV